MTALTRSYKKGERFTLSEDALENYGEKYRDKVFTVREWFDHYAKAGELAGDPHGHPGFDNSAGSALYETDALNFALYEWEMEPA